MTPIDPLQTAFWLACDALIWRYCAPWELDDALMSWGYGLGPCAAQDLVGLDAVLAARQGAGSPVLYRMVSEGRQGKSAGWGYYRYPGGGGAVVDPLIEDLINEEAWFARMDRADLPDGELVKRLHSAVGDQLRARGQAAVELLRFPPDRLADL